MTFTARQLQQVDASASSAASGGTASAHSEQGNPTVRVTDRLG